MQSGRRLRVKYTSQDGEGSYGTTMSFTSIANAMLNGGSPDFKTARVQMDAIFMPFIVV